MDHHADRTEVAGVIKPSTGFAGVLRQREFRLLWLADIQSLLGDQIARVALSVLVFERTRSGFATAGVYALTFLPAVVGTVALGPFADRLPRRALLVAGDGIRAALLAAMALPHLPIALVATLLVVAVVVGTPWKAAESALVVDILPASDRPMGLGLRAATSQAAQLAGFAVGGAAVAVIGPRSALVIDAATFAFSAVIIRFGVRRRPPIAHHESVVAPSGRIESQPSRRWLDGTRAVFRNRQVLFLLAFSWLLGLIVVPEGLAAPYAHQLGGGPRTVGLLLAVGPGGVLLGTLLYTRWLTAPLRTALLGPFAAAAGIPLILCAGTPGLPLTCTLWALAGSFTGYQVQVVTEFVSTIAPAFRAQGIAIASAGLLGAQGVGLLGAGFITQFAAPSTAISAAGAAATAIGSWLALIRHRHRRSEAE